MSSILNTSIIGMSTILLYCYYGKLASDSYVEMSDCVFDMNWHEQPSELQKYFVLIIQHMQKTVYYHGFDMVTLDLRTFIKVNSLRLF